MFNNISTSLLSLLFLSTSIHPAISMDLDENPNISNAYPQPLPQPSESISEPLDDKGSIAKGEDTSNDVNPYERDTEIKAEKSGNLNSKKRKDRDNSSADSDKKKRKISPEASQANNPGLPPIPYPHLTYNDYGDIDIVEKLLKKNIIRNQEAIESQLLWALTKNKPWVRVMLINLSQINDDTKKEIVFNVLSKKLVKKNKLAMKTIAGFFEIAIPHRIALIENLLLPELKDKTRCARIMLKWYLCGDVNEVSAARYLIAQGLRFDISWVKQKCIEFLKGNLATPKFTALTALSMEIHSGNAVAKQMFADFVQSNDAADHKIPVRMIHEGFYNGFPTWSKKTFTHFMESTNPNERTVAEKVFHKSYLLKHPWALEKFSYLLKSNDINDKALVIEVLLREFSDADNKTVLETKTFAFSNSNDVNEREIAANVIFKCLKDEIGGAQGIYIYLQMSKNPNEQDTYSRISSLIYSANTSSSETDAVVLNWKPMFNNFKKIIKDSSGYNSDEDDEFNLMNSFIKLNQVNGSADNVIVSTLNLDVNTDSYPANNFSNTQPYVGNGFNVNPNFSATQNFAYNQVNNVNNSSNTNNNMIPQVPYTTPLFNQVKEDADTGNIDACKEIGRMYEEGLECPPNVEQALAYYKKALSLSRDVQAQLIDTQNQLAKVLQENESLTHKLNNKKQ